MELRGCGQVEMQLDSPDLDAGIVAAAVSVDSDIWENAAADLHVEAGTHALYFRVKEGNVDFAEFEIQ